MIGRPTEGKCVLHSGVARLNRLLCDGNISTRDGVEVRLGGGRIYLLLDILPALLSRRERPWAIGPFSNGDSYGVLQAIHLEESLRWVPASSEMHALPLRAWHG